MKNKNRHCGEQWQRYYQADNLAIAHAATPIASKRSSFTPTITRAPHVPLGLFRTKQNHGEACRKSASGIVMIAFAVLALIAANSPFAAWYRAFRPNDHI